MVINERIAFLEKRRALDLEEIRRLREAQRHQQARVDGQRYALLGRLVMERQPELVAALVKLLPQRQRELFE